VDKFIYSAAGIGCLLLFLVTAILSKLNWNDEIRGRVFSVVLGGAATLLIAVLTTLKPSSFQKSFVTAVPFDDATSGPPWIEGVISNLRWDKIAILARPAIQKDGKTVVSIIPPAPEERFTFCAELVQYEIVKRIRDLSRGGRPRLTITRGQAQASLSPEMKLSTSNEIPGTTYSGEIAKNRFYDSDTERNYWKIAHFTLPPATMIQLDHVSPPNGTEKFLIRLRKKMFFEYEIKIEPTLSSVSAAREKPAPVSRNPQKSLALFSLWPPCLRGNPSYEVSMTTKRSQSQDPRLCHHTFADGHCCRMLATSIRISVYFTPASESSTAKPKSCTTRSSRSNTGSPPPRTSITCSAKSSTL
jgi:hypothetical protein